MINWGMKDADEYRKVGEIARRAVDMVNGDRDAVKVMMDIEACHVSGCPLNLDGLLGADDGDFAHDVNGIYNNINREDGKLENCFLPRFALKE